MTQVNGNQFLPAELITMRHYDKKSGKWNEFEYPKVGGRLRLAHELNGTMDITTEIIQYDGKIAVVNARCSTDKGSYTGIGMASLERDAKIAPAILELAETRAIARSLRFAGYGVEKSVEHLKGKFAGLKAVQITTPEINEYTLYRLGVGAANATVNRELAALKRMFNLGARQTPAIVDKVPHIPSLKERNARKGFFEHWEFLSLREALPDYLKGFVTFAYKYGWRLEEMAGLKWSQVDRKLGIVRLEVGETKNDDGRTIYLDEELKEIFIEQWRKRKTAKKILPYVFLNRKGDDRLKRFYKTWKKACSDARIGVKVFHDFRRTAVRNMVLSGIPERVAMMISGHTTQNVFDRYNIVNDQALKHAAQRQSEYLKSLDGQVISRISPKN